jgi:hypothetical protein
MSTVTEKHPSALQLERSVQRVGEELDAIARRERWVIGEYVENDGNHTIYSDEGVVQELLEEMKGTLIGTVQEALESGELENPTGYESPFSDKEVFDIIQSIDDSDITRVLCNKDIISPAIMRDYFDEVLDIRYIVSHVGECIDVEITVGIGGPNIYVETADSEVKGYWGCDKAIYPLSYDARAEIREWGEERYDRYRRSLWK